jgi:hypothetical protein
MRHFPGRFSVSNLIPVQVLSVNGRARDLLKQFERGPFLGESVPEINVRRGTMRRSHSNHPSEIATTTFIPFFSGIVYRAQLGIGEPFGRCAEPLQVVLDEPEGFGKGTRERRCYAGGRCRNSAGCRGNNPSRVWVRRLRGSPTKKRHIARLKRLDTRRPVRSEFVPVPDGQRTNNCASRRTICAIPIGSTERA